MIERFSEMLFYMIVAFKVMAIIFTPVVTFGSYLLGFGLIGSFLKNFIRQLDHILWPRKLIMIGLFTLFFPLSFQIAMWVGDKTLNVHIDRELKVFTGVSEKIELEDDIIDGLIREEDIEEKDPQNIETSNGSEKQKAVGNDDSKIIRSESEESKSEIAESKGFWETINPLNLFKSDNEEDVDTSVPENLDSTDSEENQQSFWERINPLNYIVFWENDDKDPGFWGSITYLWDQVKSVGRVIKSLIENATELIDASLTLPCFVFNKGNNDPSIFSLLFVSGI